MRKVTIAAALAAVLLAAACPARADLIAIDDFESYTAGVSLNNGAGGTGWTSNWATNSQVKAEAGVIPEYAGAQSMEIDTIGDNNNIARRSFPAQTGTVYVGLVLRTTGGWSSDEFLQLYLNTSTGGSENSGVSGGIRNNTNSPYFARIDGSNNTANSAVFHEDDDTRQLILKFSTSGGDYSRTDIYVDQFTEGTPDATQTTGSSGVSSLSNFHIRTYHIDSSDRIFIDSVKVATTYEEALTIPEPATLTLLALGGLALLRRRRAA